MWSDKIFYPTYYTHSPFTFALQDGLSSLIVHLAWRWLLFQAKVLSSFLSSLFGDSWRPLKRLFSLSLVKETWVSRANSCIRCTGGWYSCIWRIANNGDGDDTSPAVAYVMVGPTENDRYGNGDEGKVDASGSRLLVEWSTIFQYTRSWWCFVHGLTWWVLGGIGP